MFQQVQKSIDNKFKLRKELYPLFLCITAHFQKIVCRQHFRLNLYLFIVYAANINYVFSVDWWKTCSCVQQCYYFVWNLTDKYSYSASKCYFQDKRMTKAFMTTSKTQTKFLEHCSGRSVCLIAECTKTISLCFGNEISCLTSYNQTISFLKITSHSKF